MSTFNTLELATRRTDSQTKMVVTMCRNQSLPSSPLAVSFQCVGQRDVVLTYDDCWELIAWLQQEMPNLEVMFGRPSASATEEGKS